MGKYFERWKDIGRSAGRTNKSFCELGVRLAYAAARRKMPQIVWFNSPQALVLARGALTESALGYWIPEIQDQRHARQQVKDLSVRTTDPDLIVDVRGELEIPLRTLIWQNIGSVIVESVWHNTAGQPLAFARAQNSALESLATARLSSAPLVPRLPSAEEFRDFGIHDAHQLASLEFYRDICTNKSVSPIGKLINGVSDNSNALKPLLLVAQNAGWYAAYGKYFFACVKPERIVLNEHGVLHNPAGPAVQYPDGWCVFAIHGVPVPEKVILQPDKITIADIDANTNPLARGLMAERYGLVRYWHDKRAYPVHQDEFGTLYALDEERSQRKMVHVVNATPEPDGTFRDYFLRVPPEITTARAAVAWTFDLKQDEFNPYIAT